MLAGGEPRRIHHPVDREQRDRLGGHSASMRPDTDRFSDARPVGDTPPGRSATVASNLLAQPRLSCGPTPDEAS
jgi:hypothetical protein